MASVKGSHEKMKCLLGRSDKLSGASTSTTASGEKKKFSFSGMLDKGFEKQRRSNEKIKEEMKK